MITPRAPLLSRRRKAVNHPYLFLQSGYDIDDNLWRSSGARVCARTQTRPCAALTR